MSWYAAYRAKAATPPAHRVNSVNSVNSVKSVSPAHDGEDPADDAGTDLEPRLPALGTPARMKLDRDHAAMLAGLLKVAKPYEPRTRAEHTDNPNT